MDKLSEFEIPSEQRCLLNAGHGPPNRFGSPVAFGIYNDTRRTPATSSLHRNATCSDFRSHGISFCENDRCQLMFLDRPEIADKLVWLQTIENKDQQLQKLSNNELHWMPTNGGQKFFEDLLRDNEELKRQLTAAVNELKSLRMKYDQICANYYHLTKLLTSLPDAKVKLPHTSEPDDFIHLVASEDVASSHNMVNGVLNLNDNMSMSRSVQCSEPSMEPTADGKGEAQDMVIAGPTIEKKVGGISSSSSASSESFEVVGQGSPVGSPADREDVQMPSNCLKAEAEEEALRSSLSELSRQLKAEIEERKRETAELRTMIDEMIQRGEKVNGKDRQFEDQRQSELVAANWKLTEQNIELTRDNEDLKKKDLDCRSAVSCVNKLEEELQRKQQRLMETEGLLETQRHLIQELEAQIRDVEHMRLAESFQKGDVKLSGSASELETENSLLKHQIEAYKEDFEVERKDRETLVAQKDTLQRCFDTLRSDLDVARQQLKKYESEITLLRIDNNTLRTKLRSVTEEVDAMREMRQSKTSTCKEAASPAQIRPMVQPPVLHNTFALPKPSSTPSGPPGDWECQTCTFKNPAPRTFCEMCGTHEPLRMSSAAQVPNYAYVPNIPVRELRPVQWNVAQPGSPLLSNLRNYGDIETD